MALLFPLMGNEGQLTWPDGLGPAQERYVDTETRPMHKAEMTISVRVRELRRERAMTQEDLAARAGVGVATIQRAERGQGVSADTVASIASAFNVDAAKLTGSAAEDEQPYLPLDAIVTGRQLLAILGTSARLDFGYADITDLAQAALIEQLQDYCSPLGPERIPARVVARVKLELEGSNLLDQLAAAKLPVSGATFELRCHEIDDDCGAGMPVLMGAWNEVRGVLRVGADGQLVTRVHIMHELGEYETPTNGVIFPSAPDQNTAPERAI